MQNTKVLEMLNSNRIEELKEMLKDEIYADVLKNKPGANKRYAAMKKYFSYTNMTREFLQKPSIVEFQGDNYTSFCNSYSIALTKEPCGAIELYTDTERYPNVARLITKKGNASKINFAKVIAEAKSRGYKLIENEVDSHKFKFLLHYKNTYFKLGLVDATFSIINDGELTTVYIGDDERSPLTMETSIGICAIMPISLGDGDRIIIHAEEVVV